MLVWVIHDDCQDEGVSQRGNRDQTTITTVTTISSKSIGSNSNSNGACNKQERPYHFNARPLLVRWMAAGPFQQDMSIR